MITLDETDPEQIINIDVDLIDIQTIVVIDGKQHVRVCFSFKHTTIFYSQEGTEVAVG